MLPYINTLNLIGVINAVTDFRAFEDNKHCTKKKKTLRYIFIATAHPFFQSHSNQTNAKVISRRQGATVKIFPLKEAL